MFTAIIEALTLNLNEESYDSKLLKIVTAMHEGDSLGIVYCDKDNVISLRAIQPHTLYRAKDGKVLVRAYDEMRKAERQFNLKGIHSIEI